MRKLWKIIIAVILCFAILNLAWMIWRNVKYSRYTDGMKKTVFSQLTVPRYAREDEEGYDWMTMAVSELSAVGAPSADLANRLNSLFGPCALVSIMAVCVAVANNPSKRFRFGVYCFAAMEWLCNVGYTCFPWVSDAPNSAPQNVMHLLVTVLVVIFSLAALALILLGAKKAGQKSLGIWAGICLAAMLIGPIGTGLLPASVFGLFERLGTFSVVVFNAVLGMYLFSGKLEAKNE